MECEKCFSPWDTETHIPKILACGHTICQNCIYEMSKKIISKEEKLFKCPLCNYEIMNITTKEDVLDLKQNVSLLNIVDKVSMNKSRVNISNNISLSMSAHLNTSSFLVNDSSININSKDLDSNINNICYYPICNLHQSKAYFYYFKNKEKKYLCLFCLENNQIDNYDKLIPLPNLDVQNELKINACKKKLKLLLKEIDKIQSFLERYHKKFENENKTKIEELFKYIYKIVDYNHTTALTLFEQCKNEQKNQIEKKVKELINLRQELDSSNQKLDEISNDDLFKDKINPNTQLQLEKIYNRLGNCINYENELSLFQMDININEEVKDSLFDLIQNSYRIDIDFLKMKNGDLPNIKELLKKSTSWPCSCGQEDNDINKIICSKCSRYRDVVTYNNILFNPLLATKKEIKDLQIRRNHESKVFISLNQRNMEIKKKDKNYKDFSFYAIDKTWFNKWKAFVMNDLSEKILPNNLKYISDNKKIGVLPPDVIDNSKISTINNIKKNNDNYMKMDDCKYRLKKGLKQQKDYIIINQHLWEWLLLNYNGGPEIKIISDKAYIPSSLAPINENNEINHNEKNYPLYKDINIHNNRIKQTFNDKFDKKLKENEIKKEKLEIKTFEYQRNSLTYENYENDFNKKNNDEQSSFLESSENDDKSNNISLDAASNKINSINTYTFNTKFCDFNNKNNKKKESFEEIEFLMKNNYNIN